MKVLLVEDEQRVSQFIREGLEEASYTVTVAYDGEYGARLAAQNSYDLIILDVMLPKMSGIDVCRLLRQENIDTPVIMLSALGMLDDKVKGLETGADDYLVKPFQFKELLARMKVLLRRRGKVATKPTYTVADLVLDTGARTVSRAGQPVALTAKEYQLLELFMRNADKVLTRSEIAEQVWDITFDSGTNVIDVYVNYLRKKIEKGGKKKLLHTIVGMGYMLGEEKKR